MQGYAILTSLRTQLGSDALLVREVQPTKTSFALFPSSSDTALEAKKTNISAFTGDC
jgi:hypothetical protein